MQYTHFTFDKLYFSLGLGCNFQYVNISPSLFPCHSVCESTKIPCHTITWTLHLSASLQRSRLCCIFLRWICEKVLHWNVCTTILQCDLPFSFEIGFINVKHTYTQLGWFLFYNVQIIFNPFWDCFVKFYLYNVKHKQW